MFITKEEKDALTNKINALETVLNQTGRNLVETERRVGYIIDALGIYEETTIPDFAFFPSGKKVRFGSRVTDAINDRINALHVSLKVEELEKDGKKAKKKKVTK